MIDVCAADSVNSLSRGERVGVGAYGLSVEPNPLTPALSPSGRGSPSDTRWHCWRLCSAVGVAIWVIALASLPSLAQARPDPGELRGLKLGLNAKTMSTDRFGDFACGSNGGPPRQRLDDWAGFSDCRREDSGLHEVYARFDDEEEYIGRAIDDPLYAGQKTGTRVAGHPIILSVLFDDGGVLRGLRFVTDPRGDPAARRMAHLLRLAIINRYDPAGWTCTDLPAAPGETAVGGIFLKQRCEKLTPERRLTVEARFLRKPGQNDIDPVTGEYTSGQFESWPRFELFDPAYKTP